MKLEALLRDRQGVSPVIAVILMVAITVILAAVIGAFVLDVTDNEEAAPQIALDINYNNDALTEIEVAITGTNTKEVTASEIGFKGENIGVSSGATMADISGTYTADSEVRAGDSVVLSGVDTDTRLEVVWIDDSGKAAAILGEFDGPDA